MCSLSFKETPISIDHLTFLVGGKEAKGEVTVIWIGFLIIGVIIGGFLLGAPFSTHITSSPLAFPQEYFASLFPDGRTGFFRS